MTGTVYLVGAGPGAPDLLTLRAARLLERADIVFYDALVHPHTLALATKASKVPVGKRSGRHSTAQRFINKRLIDAARTHACVVRLKGGDPMLFGRAQEEIAALEAAGVPYAVVPGVTAALACSAELGIALTQRGVSRSVAMVTPRVGAGEAASTWADVVLQADSAAIYMGAGEAEAIATTLIARGKTSHTPTVVVENASLPECRAVFTTLAGLATAAANMTGPALIFIGQAFVAKTVATDIVDVSGSTSDEQALAKRTS